MRPMSLAESKVSNGAVTLSDLQAGEPIAAKSPLSYADMAEQAVRGGWPGLLRASTKQALIFNRSYCDDLCDSDIPNGSGAQHDSSKMRRFLMSLASNVSTEATQKTLGTDVREATVFADPSTVVPYLSALKQVFGVEEQPAWSVSLRSRARLRSSPKLHLADPALACAMLDVCVGSPRKVSRWRPCAEVEGETPNLFTGGTIFGSTKPSATPTRRDHHQLQSAQSAELAEYKKRSKKTSTLKST